MPVSSSHAAKTAAFGTWKLSYGNPVQTVIDSTGPSDAGLEAQADSPARERVMTEEVTAMRRRRCGDDEITVAQTFDVARTGRRVRSGRHAVRAFIEM